MHTETPRHEPRTDSPSRRMNETAATSAPESRMQATPEEQRLALEKKYAQDKGFNPLFALTMESVKHEGEAARLFEKKRRVFNEPLNPSSPKGAEQQIAERIAQYERQIADQKARAEWFIGASHEAERGFVDKARTYFRQLEAKMAENLRSAFSDEQAAAEKLRTIAEENDPAKMMGISEQYGAARKELADQRERLVRVQDQLRYLDILGEKARK